MALGRSVFESPAACRLQEAPKSRINRASNHLDGVIFQHGVVHDCAVLDEQPRDLHVVLRHCPRYRHTVEGPRTNTGGGDPFPRGRIRRFVGIGTARKQLDHDINPSLIASFVQTHTVVLLSHVPRQFCQLSLSLGAGTLFEAVRLNDDTARARPQPSTRAPRQSRIYASQHSVRITPPLTCGRGICARQVQGRVRLRKNHSAYSLTACWRIHSTSRSRVQRPAATSKMIASASSTPARSSDPFNKSRVSMAAWPTRLFPSTNG